jgi:CcmD family protein
MTNFKKIISLLAFLLVSVMGFAQDKNPDSYRGGMADLLRSNGKIYVVVAVVLIILIGLILYVWRLDRKMSKLEKESKS